MKNPYEKPDLQIICFEISDSVAAFSIIPDSVGIEDGGDAE